MLRKTSKQPTNVSEKLSKLLAHPNSSDSDEGSDIDAATAARVVDFEPDEYDLPDPRSTEFRKRNVKLLSEQSERYKGKIASRKQVEANESDGDSEELAYEESDSDEELEQSTALQAFNNQIKAGQQAVDSESDEMEQDDAEMESDDAADAKDEDESDEEESGEADSDDDEFDDKDDDDEEIAIEPNELMTKTNQQAEIQKGLCVQNQLRVWERLLQLRINTQKVSSKANQLPAPAALQTYSADNEQLQAVLKEAQERSSKLLQQLLLLQSALTQQHSELRQSVKRKQPSVDSVEPPSKRFADALHSNFQEMRSYRNQVLLKWDDRTKLLTPGAGIKRKSMEEDYDIIKKIDSALANRETLIEKSQMLKTNQEPEHIQRQPHVYDDSDFYHQQLRELIEYKASTTSNMSEITKQFVELQKLRQKMKKKVDTRASKGRKLRYVVHNKLINFMAPNEASDWTEDSKTELYKSLFV